MAQPLTLPARFNVADHFILPHQRPGKAERPYMLCGEDVLTFGALHEQANRVAGALRGLGIRPGDRVAMLMRESLEFPAVFWGIIRCGGLPIPLNTVFTAPEYRYYLEDSGAAALVVDEALWSRVRPALTGGSSPRHVLVAGREPAGGIHPGATWGEGLIPLKAAMAHAAPAFESHPAAPDDPAFWLYTSGSTGTPKAAVHRQRDMALVAARYLPQVLGLRPDDLTFSAPKMFFAYGLGNSLYFPMAVGSAAVIDPAPASASSAFATLSRYRPSVFYAVPSLYRAMLALYEDWRTGRTAPPTGALPRLEHLRMALSGGEALPSDVFHRWRELFGMPILDGVGSTEALHFYLANTPDDAKPGSAGRPVPGYDLRLVNREGEEAGVGEVGELWLRGESLTGGYWRKPERNALVFRGGWLATGDLFVKDATGCFAYRGRKDDVFKVGGSWINPEEVEQALLTHPAVAECAVVGCPDDGGLMTCHAYIVESVLVAGNPGADAPPPIAQPPVAHPVASTGPAEGRGNDALEKLLRAHLAERLASFKHPAQFHLVSSIPRTASGKVRRFLLRQEHIPHMEPAESLGAATGVTVSIGSRLK